METRKVKNKNGNMVDRIVLGKLEGEALEICRQMKYFIYADRKTGDLYASLMGNRLSDEERAERKAKKLEKLNAKLKALNAKKAELEG